MFTTEYIKVGRMELAWTNSCITTFCDNSSVIKDLYQWSMLEFYVTNFFISYLGMKSWDLYVCERASTIRDVGRVKKK